MIDPAEAAAVLAAARGGRRPVAPFTDVDLTLDEGWGYDVQALDRAARVAAGEWVVGAKLGLTSVAKQQRMGVDVPIVGFLTDAMRRSTDEPLDLSGWIQPRIEPEIAFVLGADVAAPLDVAGARAVVRHVLLAAEAIDSRFERYRFRLPDVLADDTSAAGFVLGEPRDPDAVGDLAAVGCTLEVDGRVAATATGAAILGHPLEALVRLSHHVARRGEVVPAGSVVLAGAMTDAVPLHAGARVSLRSPELGVLDVRA